MLCNYSTGLALYLTLHALHDVTFLKCLSRMSNFLNLAKQFKYLISEVGFVNQNFVFVLISYTIFSVALCSRAVTDVLEVLLSLAYGSSRFWNKS